MQKFFQTIPAKILLFGEYAVLYGARAFAVPSNIYYGKLNFGDLLQPTVLYSNKNLRIFAKYLEKNFKDVIQTDELLYDIEQGLYLQTNIPQGFGLGSSGVLVASIAKHYAKYENFTLDELHNLLKNMENAFHGNSSGIDPLVSFLNENIIIQNEKIQVYKQKIPNINYKLIDSGNPRNTKHFVGIFKEKMLDKTFYKKFRTKYIVTNNLLLESYLKEDTSLFEVLLAELSYLQLEMFAEMIPFNIIQKWRNALKEKTSAYKLCGAGGGGMFLQFNFEDIN